MNHTLNIIESAYRATLEEQDDTIVWITGALKNAGADVDVLLEGNAVSYAVSEQDTSGLRIGNWTQSEPPRLSRDVERLVEKGARVYFVADDAAVRGLEGTEMVEGVEPIQRAALPELFDKYQRVWRW